MTDTVALSTDTKMMDHTYGANLVRVDANTPIDQWAATVGLNYRVEKMPIEVDGRPHAKFQALRRDDTGEVLDVVSPKFKYPQPMEILTFFDDLIRQQNWNIEAAGATMGGRRIWAIAKVGTAHSLANVDPIEGRALFYMTYHKGMAGSFQFLSQRLFCTNQLPYLTSHPGARSTSHMKLPHYRHYDESEIKASLGLQPEKWAENIALMESYTKVPMPKAERRAYWADVLGFKLDEWRENEDDRLPHAERRLEKLESYALTSPGAALSTAKDTLWGAINALTYWTDHDRRSRGNDGSGRLNAIWWGSGAALKDKAIDAANQIVKLAA